MRILIASDVFPPKCSGSGWSSYYLSRELRKRGHDVAVVRPRFGADVSKPTVKRTSYDNLPVAELQTPVGTNPLTRAWDRNIQTPRLLQRFIAAEARRFGADLIHAQHMWTTPAAVGAARQLGKRGKAPAVVSTVRDYWPVSHFTTLQLPGRNAQAPQVACPECGTLIGLLRGLVQAQGAKGVAQWPLVPFWHALALGRRRALGRADEVIAVSQFVAATLLQVGAVRQDILNIVPNLVDVARVAEIVADAPPYERLGLQPGQDFLLFAGKLDAHKGAQLLPQALAQAGVSIPLIIAGEGPLQAQIERDSHKLSVDVRVVEWLSNDEVLRLMSRCAVLLVPSIWQEPLSRVLLEGAASGAAMLALKTGGTADVIQDGYSGALPDNMDQFALRLKQLLAAPAEREQLRQGALQTARAKFDAQIVAAQVENVYHKALKS